VAQRDILREVVGLLREVTGEDEAWAAGVTVGSRLDDDLRLESIELAELHDRMRQRYGERVDLLGYLAGLDLDEIIALEVADLVCLVAGPGAGRP
jgi:acyl carrier protein